MNVSDFNWNMIRRSDSLVAGMSFELTMLNYTEDESKRILELKKRGANHSLVSYMRLSRRTRRWKRPTRSLRPAGEHGKSSV